MNFNFKDIATATMILFAVVDIIGGIPIIMSLREKAGKINSEKASIIAGVVMITFLFLGESILELIGINVNEFAIAGSLIVFFIALEMTLGITIFKETNASPDLATVFPLAFPLLAGPGCLTTILSLRAEYNTDGNCCKTIYHEYSNAIRIDDSKYIPKFKPYSYENIHLYIDSIRTRFGSLQCHAA